MQNTHIQPALDTFFQQKWKAKAMTRAYHGEHVSEHRWARLFTRKLQSVVPMNPQYMAANDGSKESQGRGSGRQMKTPAKLGGEKRHLLEEGVDMLTGLGNPSRGYTPYMNMTFAPLERRLDTAIFRAMFASSARQARSFVIQGHVKVNGIKVDKPAYMLNPGDMFQVDPELVMYATGVQKGQGLNPPLLNAATLKERSSKRQTTDTSDMNADRPRPSAYRPGDEPPDIEAIRASQRTGAKHERLAEEAAALEVEVENMGPEDRAKVEQQRLKNLIASAKDLLGSHKDEMNAAKKRRVRAWRDNAKVLLSKTQRAARQGGLTDKDIMEELTSFVGNLSVEDVKGGAIAEAGKPKPTETAAAASGPSLSADQQKMIAEMLVEEEKSSAKRETSAQSPEDSNADEKPAAKKFSWLKSKAPKLDKPYQQPWSPRPFMAAFAVIPRYLEVNPNICAAVYLRHPVARPGSAEVPTPFPEFVNALSFNYYLRRR
ncbi:hypothetical protein MKZ38_003218 [Zalerion maritima]|uniref:RNA-binding S4 domain-containing protein n=1 Tax=Zalerion maritima TaxID=339359 RepID=A0AAD5S049_9PEZI|nr:hypothetical protein MKZ38_003218 [Zalerion maritima]